MKTRIVFLGIWIFGCAARCAADSEIDLTADDMKALAADYAEAQNRQVATRHTQLTALVQKHLDEAKDMLTEKKVSGNISGMAVASAAVRLFEACKEQLEKQQNFKLPAKSRRELMPIIQTCSHVQKRIEKEHAAAMDGLRKKYYDLFKGKSRAQIMALPGPEQLKAEFEKQKREKETERAKAVAEAEKTFAAELAELRKTTDAQIARRTASQGGGGLKEDDLQSAFRNLVAAIEVAKPAEVKEAAGGKETGAGAAEKEMPDLPEILASSGPGTEWTTIGRWFGEINGIEVIQIPVMHRSKSRKKNSTSSITGNAFEVRYEAVRELEPGDGYAFRLKSLPKKQGCDVLEWPKNGNDWKLVLRLRPARAIPSSHGVEIQVSYTGASALSTVGTARPAATIASAAAEEDKTPRITIGIKTAPPDAFIYLDGRLVREGNRVPKTPCTVSMPAGAHNIVLRKTGYLDGVIPAFDAQEGKIIPWTFRKDPAFVQKTVRLMAKTTWRASGVEVMKGDQILVRPSGKWSCGSKGEKVGGGGYPNNQKYYHYYLDTRSSPRQVGGANYGALLMRIGTDGRLVVVGRGVKTIADRTGILYFDVNEATGSARKDNSGMLTLVIQKSPPLK